jgi:hypothetical protein
VSLVSPARSTTDNKSMAAALSGEVLSRVRYFRWRLTTRERPTTGLRCLAQPDDGVELETSRLLAAIWGQYEWDYGVDLFDGPVSVHLIEQARVWVDVSDHRLCATDPGRAGLGSFHLERLRTRYRALPRSLGAAHIRWRRMDHRGRVGARKGPHQRPVGHGRSVGRLRREVRRRARASR